MPHPRLVGSPLHVKRLLMNVLSNAIKYNREKGRVMLDCFELSSTGDKVQICFVCADTGIGMSEEFQKRMFEPFTQENAGARSVYGGTGLGMSITKSLVDKMGGTIGVVDEETANNAEKPMMAGMYYNRFNPDFKIYPGARLRVR